MIKSPLIRDVWWNKNLKRNPISMKSDNSPVIGQISLGILITSLWRNNCWKRNERAKWGRTLKVVQKTRLAANAAVNVYELARKWLRKYMVSQPLAECRQRLSRRRISGRPKSFHDWHPESPVGWQLSRRRAGRHHQTAIASRAKRSTTRQATD